MKIQKCFLLVLIIMLLTGPVSHALTVNAPSLPDEPSFSSCGVARGFAAGAMLGATIAALTPGGQTAAVILGLAALSMHVGTSIWC